MDIQLWLRRNLALGCSLPGDDHRYWSDEDTDEAWRALSAALGDRPNWHCSVEAGSSPDEIMWRFGIAGGAWLVISMSPGGAYECFNWRADQSIELTTVNQVVAWAEQHEGPALAGNVNSVKEMTDSITDAWAEVSHWAVAVHYREGVFEAYAPAVDVSPRGVSPELPALLQAVREQICEVLGMPAGQASSLQLVCTLTPEASGRVAEGRTQAQRDV